MSSSVGRCGRHAGPVKLVFEWGEGGREASLKWQAAYRKLSKLGDCVTFFVETGNYVEKINE